MAGKNSVLRRGTLRATLGALRVRLNGLVNRRVVSRTDSRLYPALYAEFRASGVNVILVAIPTCGAAQAAWG